MPTFSSHVWSGRSGRSKLCLVACLVLSSAVLLIDAKEKVQRAQSAQSAQSAQRGWDVGKAKCCVGKVLRAPDTLILQSLNRITEYVKLKLFLRPSQVSAKENAWLNSAKDEICARFGISPVPELLICDDSRMLAQAGPHGCRGFGNGWVVLSKGVLETLPPQEVVAVLAHELTHVAKNHHLKRGFLILDFYRLMLLWSLKQKEDSAMLDLQTTVATVTMWLLLGLRSRSQEMEADRHMLDIVTPSTAFSALARMHYPLDDPQEVLVDAKELLQILARSLGQRPWKQRTPGNLSGNCGNVCPMLPMAPAFRKR